jgi:gamma-glutamyltranspeptidase/glutathione hydrolase
VLENFDVGALPVNSPEYIHLFSEVFKLCYADRAAYMGDPAFVKVPMKGLLSKEYAKTRAALVDRTRSQTPQPGKPFDYESISTTHFSIGDSEGNLVAVTKTVNHFFGSCVCPKGTGLVLNDQMVDFSIDPASANAVAGGKIPLSSMSPTFLLKDGKPFAVIGSPGGTRIISTVAQVASKLIDHSMTIEEAVNSPRFGDDITANIIYESRISRETVEALKAMGHQVTEFSDWNRIMGSVNAIRYEPDGTISGAADPRRDGLAVGI